MDQHADDAPLRSRGVAVALGAGGARGLAHLVVIEALEELGVTPTAIAGSSMGALIGAAWAAGMPARDIRSHLQSMLRNRADVMARLLRARVGRFVDLLGGQLGNPILLDAERILDLFWPQMVPDRFDELIIPFSATATDFFGRREWVFDKGPLAPAVAASMAIPGLIRPVEIDGRMYVDGGATNPLPYGLLMGRGDFVIACDVTGGPVTERAGFPSPFEAMFGSAQIMQGAITTQMLQSSRPHLLVRPDVDRYRVLDFFHANQILEACAPMKDEIKRAVDAHLATA
ncbi:MAG: Patatin [Hyphomicrobiales bacterium]|nr:Patatin [Hyphomicrobiales bacterium]